MLPKKVIEKEKSFDAHRETPQGTNKKSLNVDDGKGIHIFKEVFTNNGIIFILKDVIMIDKEVVSLQGLKNYQNNCYMYAIIQCLRGSKLRNLNLKDSGDWFKHMIELITKNTADSNDLLSFLSVFQT